MKSTPKLWIVYSENGELGPFDLFELRSLVSRGVIVGSTLLRQEDSRQWVKAVQVPAIFSKHEDCFHAIPLDPSKSTSLPTRPPALPPKQKSWHRHLGDSLLVLVPGIIAAAVILCALLFMLFRIDSNDGTPLGEVVAIDWNSGSSEPSPGRPDPKVEDTPKPSSSNEIPLFDEAAVQQSSSPKSEEQTITNKPTSETPNLDKANATQTITNTEELVASTEQSVALIRSAKSIGSGFMVSKNLLATNYHVIADATSEELNIYFPSAPERERGPFRASIRWEDPATDIALLQATIDKPAASIDLGHKFRRGQEVIAIGSPGLFQGREILPNAVAKGIASNEMVLEGQRLYQLSMSINGGNSGGPVFGMDGRVIGVITSKSITEEGIAFCVPAEELGNAIAKSNTLNAKAVEQADNLHRIRRLIRVTVGRDFELALGVRSIRDLFEEQNRSLLQEPALEIASRLHQKWDAELLRDETQMLERLLSESGLDAYAKNKVNSLIRRHREFRSALKAGRGTLQVFHNEIETSMTLLLEQAKQIDAVLPLQLPSLLARSLR